MRIRSRRMLGALVTLAIGACDPVYSLGARQALSPPPTLECLESELLRSPFVVTATRLEDPREQTFAVVVRDAAAKDTLREAWVTLDRPRGAPPVLSMKYQWIGYQTPPPDQRGRMLGVATAVLAQLQAACAPGATTKVECFSSKLGGASVCDPG